MGESVPPCPPPRDAAVLKLFADELLSPETIRDRLAEQYGTDWANLTICRLIRTRKLLIIQECYDQTAPGAPPEVYIWSQEDIDLVWQHLIETDPPSSLPSAFQRIYSAVVANGFVTLLIAESQPADLLCTITMRPACAADSETPESDGDSNDPYPEPKDSVWRLVQAIDRQRDQAVAVSQTERIKWVEDHWPRTPAERTKYSLPDEARYRTPPSPSTIKRALFSS